MLASTTDLIIAPPESLRKYYRSHNRAPESLRAIVGSLNFLSQGRAVGSRGIFQNCCQIITCSGGKPDINKGTVLSRLLTQADIWRIGIPHSGEPVLLTHLVMLRL